MQPNQISSPQYRKTQDLHPAFQGIGVQPQILPHGTMNGMHVYVTTGQFFLETAPLTAKPWVQHYPIYCQAKTELAYANHDSGQQEPQEESNPFKCSLCQRKSVSLKGLRNHLYRHHKELSSAERKSILRAFGNLHNA
ncbi:C2H2-type zinc finger protein [Endozoicomonas sp. YOMI1]|uniref:C2H2-type zinc finger protein n=1 Tax=Endozoicomonas sp. YOMI1 TaxID=2828739 RepID=UPI00214914B2|nr:C2H2-type zinc finger protein [Endozoicomonas sp. YOMI1]